MSVDDDDMIVDEDDPELEALQAQVQLKQLALKFKIALFILNNIIEQTGISRETTLQLTVDDGEPGDVALSKILDTCQEEVDQIIGEND